LTFTSPTADLLIGTNRRTEALLTTAITAGTARPGLADWATQSIRLVAFTDKPVDDRKSLATDTFEAVFGAPAATVISQAQAATERAFSVDAQTQLQSVIVVAPRRIDVASACMGMIETGSIGLGAFPDALKSLQSWIDAWLAMPGYPSLERLALLVELRIVKPTYEDALSTIASLLPAVSIDDPLPRDFLFRANRRCHSSVVEALLLNRLTSWEAASYTIQDISPQQNASSPSREIHLAQFTTDCNTDIAGKGPFPVATSRALLNELSGLVASLLEHGDPR